jgi:hypothetical protein
VVLVIVLILVFARTLLAMQVSIVVLMCHMLGTISQPICREEIAIKSEMQFDQCILSQPALDQWKASSIYQSDAWWISEIKCVPGDYVVRDAT